MEYYCQKYWRATKLLGEGVAIMIKSYAFLNYCACVFYRINQFLVVKRNRGAGGDKMEARKTTTQTDKNRSYLIVVNPGALGIGRVTFHQSLGWRSWGCRGGEVFMKYYHLL